MVLVPGVGEEAPTETSRAVADGLVTHADGYTRGEAGTIELRVPTGKGAPMELYRADRLSLRRGDAEIDLVEMRWSDISRFPQGLLAFFTSLFGLGLQLMTAGLEASHRADDGRGTERPPSEDDEVQPRWNWVVVAAAVTGLLAGALAGQEGGREGGVLVGALAAGAVLLVALVVYRGGAAVAVANGLIEAASWWAAAIVVPLTVIAAVCAAALWLVVDDALGLADPLAAGIVGAVGAFALWGVARGIAGGGWRYEGRGWTVALDPLKVAAGLYVVAIAIGAWQVAATGSIAVGVSRTSLIATGFGLRGAWLAAVTLIAAALLALAVLALVPLVLHRRRAPTLRQLWFTEVVTTAVSTLVVALVGAILIGGVGAVAYSTATDATWGRDAPDVRCLAEATSWSWSSSCGTLGAGWAEEARAIRRDLTAADAREAPLDDARLAAVADPDPASRTRLLDEIDATQAEIDRLREAVADVEIDTEAAPVWWAQDLYSILIRPLGWMLAVLAALVVVDAIALAALVLRALGAKRPRGQVLTRVLRMAPGWTGGVVLLVLGLSSAAWTWFTWTLADEDLPGLGRVTGVQAAVTSAGVLGLLAVARVVPVDPRAWRQSVGGGLEKLRGVVDRAYDVATYLRIDPLDKAGVRTRIIRRFRALLGELEGRYDEIVIVAHSQGTILTIATLFGDAMRRDAEAQGSLWGVRRWTDARGASPLTSRLHGVVTMGSPFRQTYEARLPGQYDWLDPAKPEALAERLHPFSLTWVNAYRARDFVGRAIFQDPLDPSSACEGRGHEWRLPAQPRPVRLVDVCLRGRGHHTGYWNDRELIGWLHGLLRAAEPRDPPRYTIEPASPAE